MCRFTGILPRSGAPMTGIEVEILVGVAFGLLFGHLAAVFVGLVAYGLEVTRTASLPKSVSVVGAIAIVLAFGAVGEPTTFQEIPDRHRSLQFPVAALLAGPLALYANSVGRRIGQDGAHIGPPPIGHERVLDEELTRSADAQGTVTIRSTKGTPATGYPPLPPTVQTAIEAATWRVPADLSLRAIEDRIETRLRTNFGLRAVSVSVDTSGQATVAAGPPAASCGSEIPPGCRALTLTTILPAGISPADEIGIQTSDEQVTGTVITTTGGGTNTADGWESGGCKSNGVGNVDWASERRGPIAVEPTSGQPTCERGANRVISDAKNLSSESDSATKDADKVADTPTKNGQSTSAANGGYGRITVAVPTVDCGSLLAADDCIVYVPARETDPALEAISLLERAGIVINNLDGRHVATSSDDDRVLARDDVHVLAVSRTDDSADQSRSLTIDPGNEEYDRAVTTLIAAEKPTLEELQIDVDHRSNIDEVHQ